MSTSKLALAAAAVAVGAVVLHQHESKKAALAGVPEPAFSLRNAVQVVASWAIAGVDALNSADEHPAADEHSHV